MIHVAKLLPIPSTPGRLPRGPPPDRPFVPLCARARGRVKFWEEFSGKAPHPSPLPEIIVSEGTQGFD